MKPGQLVHHFNSLNKDIKFTTEFEGEEMNALAFFDTNTIKKEEGSLKLSIYRKPTHTDQYLHFRAVKENCYMCRVHLVIVGTQTGPSNKQQKPQRNQRRAIQVKRNQRQGKVYPLYHTLYGGFRRTQVSVPTVWCTNNIQTLQKVKTALVSAQI